MKLRKDSISYLINLSTLLLISSCSGLSSKQGQDLTVAVPADSKIESKKMEVGQNTDILNKDIILEIKKLIREELIPEIRGASFIPKAALKKQRKAKESLKNKTILGRVEVLEVDSPDFSIKARVDTGARTCSIHAENIIEKEIDGKKYIQFESFDSKNKKHIFFKEVISKKNVKSSNGETMKRYVVKMNITIGSDTVNVNVNLNDREDLRYNFLLGRNLLMGKYVVDVSQSRLLGN